jgi:glutathione S-transferase
MKRPVFYGNRESGHSYKVKLALALLGIDHEYRHIDLRIDRPDRPADFRAVGRFGEVPVLVVEGNAVVQSNAILIHLMRSTARLTGDEGLDRIVEWLFWEANRIGFSLPNLRLARRFGGNASPDVVDWLEQRVRIDLDRLDEEFGSGKPFLTGINVSIADLSCCGYLFWAEQAGIEVASWRNVEAWLGRISALDGWRAPYDLLAPVAEG